MKRETMFPFFIIMKKNLYNETKNLLDTVLENENCFLVDSKYNEEAKEMNFFIDSVFGLSLAMITKVSKQLKKKALEEEIELDAFKINISSPGADKPLVDQRQFVKHIGKNFEIEKINNEKFIGKLKNIKDNLNYIFEIKINKNKIEVEMKFNEIKTAKVIIGF